MTDDTQMPVDPAAAPPEAAQPSYSFSVGHVLSTALRISKHNFVPFFLLACVVKVPATLLTGSVVVRHALLGLVVQTLLTAFTQAVVCYGTLMELQGSRPSMGACIANGFSQLGRVLGVTLVSTLAICGAMILLVVPGIIVSLMLYIVVPVTLAEGLGVGAAMRRSRELTYGYKGDIFLMLMLAGGLGIVLEYYGFRELGHDAAALLCRGLITSLTTMFFAVTVAVTYFELRKVREGVSVPELAPAFARIRK